MMHPTYTSFIIILACGSILYVGCQEESSDRKYGNSNGAGKADKLPQDQWDLGPFVSFDSYYNETKLKTKLRLSKSYFKQVMSYKFAGTKIPLVTVKQTLLEELIHCDNLTLLRPLHDIPIDCKPIQAHVLNDTYQSAGIGADDVGSDGKNNYARRFSYRSNSKFHVKSGGVYLGFRHDIQLYPLREDFIQRNIESSAATNSLNELKIAKSNLNLGYYFQANLNAHHHISFICSGNLFLSINITELFVRSSREFYPEHFDQIDYIFDQAQKHGYLFSLQGVSCHNNNSDPSQLSLNTDFTILQKLQFPYITVRHSIFASPMRVLLSYNATVDQERDLESSNPSFYNTTISIDCSSILDSLNFKLNQVFVNEGDKGSESMLLARPDSSILVQGGWNMTTIAKSAKLFYRNWQSSDAETKVNLSEAAEIMFGAFANPGDNFSSLTIQLKLKNHLIKSLGLELGELFTAFIGDGESKLAGKSREEL